MRTMQEAPGDPTASATSELRRELTLLDSTMINVGSMIGSGIFLVPAAIAATLRSGWLVLFVWIVGGLVSLLGALSVAELGTLYPRAGGQYVYLREIYGPVWGFLYGWTAFAVIMTASISAVAVGFATYLGYFFSFTASEIKLVAIASVLILTLVNCLGVKLGAIVQNGLTFLKMALIGGLILVGIMKGHAANFLNTAGEFTLTGTAGPVGIALVAVLWAYEGWIEITYVAGEVQNPERNIPRSLILSTLLVILFYVAVNAAYIAVLSINGILNSAHIAADTASALVGPIGAAVAVVGVIIATLGANNGYVLTGARIYYAMAKERDFFGQLARIHPAFHTPVRSLLAQGAWASLLVLTGTFEQLFTYVIFASWIFYGMTAGAVIVGRRKFPGLPRAYRTWGYPYTPIVFMGFSLFLVVATLYEDPRDALIGLGIIIAGLPAYFYWKRKKGGE